MGTLYLVATPIGNLEDITQRARRILGEVALIAAEDQRQTKKLLSALGLRTPLTSYHDHNKEAMTDRLMAELAEKDIALVSDAGSPGLNDPGYELVRAAAAAGFPVVPVPGPSAPIAALTASGLPADAFLYLGYLPRRKAARRALLETIAGEPYTLIFLEAPHRLLESLADLLDILGDRPAAVARELTKVHEEIFRGPITQAIQRFLDEAPRGEITLVVGGADPSAGEWSEDRLRAELQRRLAAGEPSAAIAKDLAQVSGWSRRRVYTFLLDIQS